MAELELESWARNVIGKQALAEMAFAAGLDGAAIRRMSKTELVDVLLEDPAGDLRRSFEIERSVLGR